MSKSRLEEMSEVIAELKEKGTSLDDEIANVEYRLSMLRAIRQVTKVDNGEPKPRGKKKGEAVQT